MHAENLVVLRFADDLHKTFFFAEDARLARGAERKLAELDVIAGFARFRFGQANGRDFGIAVSAVGNQTQIDRPRILAGEMLDGHDAFLRRKVREQRRRHHVTDCIDTLLSRLLKSFYLTEPLLT